MGLLGDKCKHRPSGFTHSHANAIESDCLKLSPVLGNLIKCWMKLTGTLLEKKGQFSTGVFI